MEGSQDPSGDGLHEKWRTENDLESALGLPDHVFVGRKRHSKVIWYEEIFIFIFLNNKFG